MSRPAVLEVTGVIKSYGGLRPLRMTGLAIAEAERVAVTGLDLAAAEVLANLLTGAALPDQGEIRIDGHSTAAIANGDEWLASLDRFGIVSGRAVLLGGMSLAQNLAMPYTLEIDPVPPAIQERVAALAAECGIAGAWLARSAGEAPPPVRVRAHLARAVALDPRLLIVEHPTADIEAADRAPLAADVARVAGSRRMAALILTMDEVFAAGAADRQLALQPATGALRPARKRWFW